ncbi:hypothetical protein UlMin_015809 [Ulmus minor]
MDLTGPRYFQSSPAFSSSEEPPLEGNPSFYGKSKSNPFVETFPDPLCKLNLKETSEFVKSFPMPNNGGESNLRRREGVNLVAQRRVEAPSTPGRPVFTFSSGNFPRKNFPSKWDDAEKWLISSSCHDSPAHPIKPSESVKMAKQSDSFKHQMEVFADKSRVTEEKVSKVVSSFHCSPSLDHHNSVRSFNGVSVSTDVFLKDKFTDDVGPVFPNFRASEPTKEGFLFKNSVYETMIDAGTEMVQHKDVGTEMTPLGSSTTSRCHTPFKSSSPARHNTPANRSGPLGLGHSNSTSSIIDIAQFQECHLAKLSLGSHYDSVTCNWSSREEEEEEISKSLRHFETGIGCQKNTPDVRAATAAWEDEEKTKCCLRYQREEAKIQAWLNLQNAKAEAQSRKLEVKIQKMRSNLEEKLMKRMAVVHRKAEEWRATAREQHSEQILKASEHAKKMMNKHHNSHISSQTSCGCFPCNNHYRS